MNSAHPLAASARLVGTVVSRKEDPRLLTGDGRYVDDVVVPGMLHAHFVRSDVARGASSASTSRPLARRPGSIAVLTAAELNPLQQGPMRATPMLGMPAGAGAPAGRRRRQVRGRPRRAGRRREPCARRGRRRAGRARHRSAPAGRRLRDRGRRRASSSTPANATATCSASSRSPGDDELEAVFAAAPHVIDQTFGQQRYLAVPMEARGVVASWSPRTHEFRVWVSTQSPHDVRTITSRITGVPERQIRVTMGDVGGGFGQKAYLARDEQVVILAGYHLGRPVKWIEDRRENLMAATSSRNERCRVRLAADADGTILAASFEQLDDCRRVSAVGEPGRDGRNDVHRAVPDPAVRLERSRCSPTRAPCAVSRALAGRDVRAGAGDGPARPHHRRRPARAASPQRDPPSRAPVHDAERHAAGRGLSRGDTRAGGRYRGVRRLSGRAAGRARRRATGGHRHRRCTSSRRRR